VVLQNRCNLCVELKRHRQERKVITHEVFQKRSIGLAMPGEVGVDLQTCYAVQSGSASSISDKILNVGSHIAENITPRKYAPRRLSTGYKEGIAPGQAQQLFTEGNRL
jgi:hypothetical protein